MLPHSFSEFMHMYSLVHYVILFLSYALPVVMFTHGAWAKVITLLYFAVLCYDMIISLISGDETNLVYTLTFVSQEPSVGNY